MEVLISTPNKLPDGILYWSIPRNKKLCYDYHMIVFIAEGPVLLYSKASVRRSTKFARVLLDLNIGFADDIEVVMTFCHSDKIKVCSSSFDWLGYSPPPFECKLTILLFQIIAENLICLDRVLASDTLCAIARIIPSWIRISSLKDLIVEVLMLLSGLAP